MFVTPNAIAKGQHAVAVLAILQSVLHAVDPNTSLERAVGLFGSTLTCGASTYDIGAYSNIHVLGGGKAAEPMAAGLCTVLGDHIKGGVVAVKHGETSASLYCGPIRVREGAHPVPDSTSVDASRALVDTATSMDPSDLAIVLLSGGASSILTLPAPGLSLSDLQQTTALLLGAGADIGEINTVRRHLSDIKGGRLAQAIKARNTLTLILSDVVGNELCAIGSGPTAPDNSTFDDALVVIQNNDLTGSIPAEVRRHLESGSAGLIPDTPDVRDEIFSRIENAIIGSNEHAVRAAVEAAQSLGYSSQSSATPITGEARDIGKLAGQLARDSTSRPRPACLVMGGETTVTIKGNGKGGRNQELALAAAISIDRMDDIIIVAFATDGTDGPTDSSGAVVTGETCARARKLGLDPLAYLDNNNAYTFFEALGDHIMTGPTRTNVADILLIFAV